MDVDSDAAAKSPRRSRPQPNRLRRDRAVWYALGGAIALAAALILYETRGTTLYNDEVAIFQGFADNFDAETVFTPRNGHLLAVASLLYEAVFSAFGPDYLVLRIIDVLGLAVLAVVLFEYLRRRVGSWLALAPVVVVLFLGASWEMILWPFSVATFGFALAAGIGALLCLERRDRRGDVAACALLVARARLPLDRPAVRRRCRRHAALAQAQPPARLGLRGALRPLRGLVAVGAQVRQLPGARLR